MWKAEDFQGWSSDGWIVDQQNIGSVADQRNRIRRIARVSLLGRCCCFLPYLPSRCSNLSEASDCSDLSFRLPCVKPAILEIWKSFVSFLFGCHIWKPSFFSPAIGYLFTSSSSSPASSTFVRFAAATTVPFVRASELARVSGSLQFQHNSMRTTNIRKVD